MRASRSSGSRSAGGERFPKLFGGVRPRRNGRGDGLRRLLKMIGEHGRCRFAIVLNNNLEYLSSIIITLPIELVTVICVLVVAAAAVIDVLLDYVLFPAYVHAIFFCLVVVYPVSDFVFSLWICCRSELYHSIIVHV